MSHGGYRNLKSVEFCDRYIDKFSRMRDQMIQVFDSEGQSPQAQTRRAARSGRQNIAEGSQVSMTSKKSEIKLVSVARASLEELLNDFEDFLRQKGLPFAVLFFISLIYLSFRFSGQVSAQSGTPSGNLQTEVSASVGEFYLNVSGFIAPYASVVLTTTDSVFMRSTVADAGGNFSFSQALIKRGFSGFCLTAVDFKKMGESFTCFSFPPASDSITMTDIFLPPTLGLSRTQIEVGGEAFAFGYTMPNALVTLVLSDGTTLTTSADSSGYYRFRIENLPVGQYNLFAKAQYQGKQSIEPTRKVQLRVLSQREKLLTGVGNLWDQFLRLLTSLRFALLLLAIPILILIIILLRKLWPSQTWLWPPQTWPWPRPFQIFTKVFKRPQKLHHWWWVGY